MFDLHVWLCLFCNWSGVSEGYFFFFICLGSVWVYIGGVGCWSWFVCRVSGGQVSVCTGEPVPREGGLSTEEGHYSLSGLIFIHFRVYKLLVL